MRKRYINRLTRILLGGLLSFAVLAWLYTCNPKAATVTLSWDYDYSVDPGCTSTVTAQCVTGFEYGTTPDAGVTLNKIGNAPNPSPVPTTLTTGISVVFKQGPPYGSVVYYVRASGVGSAPTPVLFSKPLTATPVNIVPGAPLNAKAVGN